MNTDIIELYQLDLDDRIYITAAFDRSEVPVLVAFHEDDPLGLESIEALVEEEPARVKKIRDSQILTVEQPSGDVGRCYAAQIIAYCENEPMVVAAADLTGGG